MKKCLILQTIFKILDMGRDDLIRYVEEQLNTKPDFPEFRAGDTITVYKIKEGNKENTTISRCSYSNKGQRPQ